jgi:tartrate-resistant acid phosphatase type 5
MVRRSRCAWADEDGIKNEHSTRFRDTFENVFDISNPELNTPFYAIAGNHDHSGNVTAQIAYSKHSSRWKYDDFWYTKSHTVNNVTTQVVMIDTVTIAGMAYKDHVTGMIHKNESHPMQAHLGTQLQWLEETLKSSTADYLWVVGHFPVYSQCEHGPTDEIIKHVLPLMSQYKASGYINGHDHCSGYYFDNHMAFVLTGAGMECCYSPDNLNNKANPGEPWFRMDKGKNQGDGGGFASFSVTQPPRTAASCPLSAPLSLTSSSTWAAVPSASESLSPLFHTLISQVNSTGTQIRFHKASSGAVQYEPPVIKPRAKRSLLVEQAA